MAQGERSGRALASAGPSWTRKYSLRHVNGCRAGGGSGARGVTGSRAPSQAPPFCAAKGLAAARVLRREATARARGGVVLMVWAQRRSRRRRLGRRHPANQAWRTSPPLGVPTPGAYAAAPRCPLRAEGLWRQKAFDLISRLHHYIHESLRLWLVSSWYGHGARSSS